jgi:hypothetical protein
MTGEKRPICRTEARVEKQRRKAEGCDRSWDPACRDPWGQPTLSPVSVRRHISFFSQWELGEVSVTCSHSLLKRRRLARCQWLTPCNPSCSGGRDREDHSSKPVWANSSWDPILKTPSQKRAGGVAQGQGPEFKPQYRKTKTKNEEV